MYTAYISNFILGVHTALSSTTAYKLCNIPNNHALSILAVFNLTSSNGTVYPVLMIRNPWGTVSYNKAFYQADSFWTSSTINQVPLGINLTTDGTNYGIFFVPVHYFQHVLTNIK